MTKFQQLLDSKKPGESFGVNAVLLEMSDAQFDGQATRWVRAGGGAGFTVVGTPHYESQTQHGYLDLIMLQKDDV